MSIIEQITGVWTKIGAWISDAFTQLQPVFYSAESGLTFLGTLACVGLAMSVVFLILGIIESFLRLR